MHKTFKDLKTYAQPPHKDDYYEVLLVHHALIIREVAKSSRNAVSKALNITPSSFSGIYQCILAYDILTTK